ncbi:MAG: prepilin-type N-terminal cleavage/methylation domain-containing protein [Thermodesulfobacteriota bacterium]
MKRNLDGNAGFTLLEVIIAISILTFGLLAVASMQASSIRGNALAGGVTESSTWALDRIERLAALSYTSASLSSGTHTDTSPPAGFTVTWTVTDNSPFTDVKTLLLTVSWSEGGVAKSLSFRRLIPRII